MVPISISATGGPEPFRYHMSSWKCRNALLKQVIGRSLHDLNVEIKVVQNTGNGNLLIETLKFGRQLSPTSYEVNHLIEDCSNTYLEITSTAGSDVNLMLLYE